MLRPIPPQLAWQAITALAGIFTLVSALAAPVDLWRIIVKSHQGEPFLATAVLASLPDEHISTECLSMGPESDAPGSEMPFLSTANLKLNAARSAVEISTREPITAPALALVLRVQCAGAPLYARHFVALIPPAAAKTAEPGAGATPTKRRGFHLSILRGDTVEGIAAVIFPGQRALQQDLVRQVIAGNPNVFPNGVNREVAAGTVLWFPDLREIRKSAQTKPPASAKAAAGTRRPSGSVATPPAEAAPAEVVEEVPVKPRQPDTLRRALALGDKPGPQECKQLMQLCGAEAAAVAPGSPALGEKARALESGVKELRLQQENIDSQLQRIEQSLMALQKTAATAPAPVEAKPVPPPPPPRQEIRVQTEPISWYIWLGFAGFIVAAALSGFAFGRRGSFTRGLADTDEQLDRMLATAATVMRELESAPKPAPAPRISLPMPPPTPRLPPASPEPGESGDEPPPTTEPGRAPEPAPDNQATQPTTDVDLKLESEPPAQPQIAGLSNDVLFEMDQALDNTRSMFTDVDRFIALGRTQNALSLLQFQVHKDPKDRDSWIKLMAIYRQEKMDVELAKAAREFRNHFPRENPPAV
ncbi:MAG: hypothetical protein HY067_16070 [Betaproteobacteria bacterium]|nr:hypothetical protein [Betaproteobacteria bacterium]